MKNGNSFWKQLERATFHQGFKKIEWGKQNHTIRWLCKQLENVPLNNVFENTNFIHRLSEIMGNEIPDVRNN